MKEHVPPVEVCKKLKEYLPEGFESEKSYFRGKSYHVSKPNKILPYGDWFLRDTKSKFNGSRWYEQYPAPILSEMLEILPKKITIESNHPLMKGICPYNAGLHICVLDDGIYFFYSQHGSVWHGTCKTYNKEQVEHNNMMYGGEMLIVNPATAAAKLYMWLVDEGYVTKTGGEQE